MDSRRALLVDAFTEEPLAGTPVGLVPDAGELSGAQMQAVARELGAGETAFLLPSDAADRRLRCFTPAAEVDHPGHAAVAAHAHLHESGAIDGGEHALETNADVVEVEVAPDGRAWVDLGEPTARTADLAADRVATAIGVDPVALDVDGLPLAVASAGRPLLVVPVRLLSDLGGAGPDAAALESLADAVEAAGVHAFTFDTVAADSSLHGRTWAAGEGVVEEPVTGTACGAVGAYFRRFDAFDGPPGELRVEGGHYLDRPGLASVRVGATVEVGGHATAALAGELRVPAVDDGGDIIEG